MSKLPPGWATTTIGAIASLINGRAFKPSDWSRDGLPIVRIQNLNRPDAPFNYFRGPVAERHLVRPGDLLFAWSGTPGTSFGAHIWQGPTAVLNQHIFNVRVPPELIDREFLCAAINATLDEQIAKAHGGAGLRHVTKKEFEITRIALPPRAEQERIVQRLRDLRERTLAVGSDLDRALRLVEEARTALIQGAYTLGLLPVGRRAIYPAGPPMVTVGEIATEIAYGSSAKSAKSGEVPVLRMGNIQGGELDWTNLAFTSDPVEIERYALRAGDVLFNRTNSPQLVGKTAVYHGERAAIFAGYLIRVRCNERMLPDYLAYCLNSPTGREYSWRVKSDGVSQSNINAKKLAAFRLPCPAIEDQRTIIERVKLGMERLAAMSLSARNARDAVTELERKTIAQALAGELGTSDQQDEPADVQVVRLEAAKGAGRPAGTERLGATEVKRDVKQILEEAPDWLEAQELAELYGIRFGSTPEDIEPFFAELRELDAQGHLKVEAITDGTGAKVGERLRIMKQS